MTDAGIRRAIYELTIRNGTTPSAADVAAELSASADEVESAFGRLAASRIIVLDGERIVMAAPFSGISTDFIVRAGGQSYFANCIWDALGVSPMLQVNSTIETHCPDCGEELRLALHGDQLQGAGVIHFAVPAREWWNDIVFT